MGVGRLLAGLTLASFVALGSRTELPTGAAALPGSRSSAGSLLGQPAERPTARVAFLRAGDVSILDASTGIEQRVTNGGGYLRPTWTTDGQTLFFRRYAADSRLETWRWREASGAEAVRDGLWSPDGAALAIGEPLDGDQTAARAVWIEVKSQRQELTPEEADVRWEPLAWSADGRRLVLSRLELLVGQQVGQAGGVPFVGGALWIADLAAGRPNLRELFLPRSFRGDPGVPDRVAWSPDGRWLAVGVGPATPCNSCRNDGIDFYAVPVDGGPPLALDVALDYPSTLAWAPASAFLVLSGGGGRMTYEHKQLVRVDPDSRSHLDLSLDPAWADSEPAVSPDSRWIAFARGATPKPGEGSYLPALMSRRLWLMAADGGSPRQVTDLPGWADEAPVWTRDGAWLLFVRWRPDSAAAPGAAELWAIRPDGSGEQRLVTGLVPAAGWAGGQGYYGWHGWPDVFAVAPN